jgi:hypothetical protein
MCKCIEGFLHVPLLSSRRICSYEQYSSTKTLILELIFPGFGCIYIGRFLWGILKIILVPGIYHVWISTPVDKFLNCCIVSIVGYVLIFLHLKDLILIISNKMTDYNGVILYKPYY